MNSEYFSRINGVEGFCAHSAADDFIAAVCEASPHVGKPELPEHRITALAAEHDLNAVQANSLANYGKILVADLTQARKVEDAIHG